MLRVHAFGRASVRHEPALVFSAEGSKYSQPVGGTTVSDITTYTEFKQLEHNLYQQESAEAEVLKREFDRCKKSADDALTRRLRSHLRTWRRSLRQA